VTSSSLYGSIEEPVNPLLYVLAYGAGFVAQGIPGDMDGLSKLIEEAIRYPGFSFVNVQSPCVTYGEDDNQVKEQKARMKRLSDLGHDPTNRIRAMELASEYGTSLYTGVFYRNPNPPETYDKMLGLQQKELAAKARPLNDLLPATV
jgi:2-oxoglutarate ferredoxin oxidoreductase subunit beta